MKIVNSLVILMLLVGFCGCSDRTDPRVNLGEGVKSDSLGNNIITRPVGKVVSGLIGEGVEVDQVITDRNDAGFLEVHVNGYNRSNDTRRFQYKVEWLDESGAVLDTKTSVWLPASAPAKSPFSINAVAPREEIVNFRMNTRKAD